jgi:hypothetical protein
MLKPPAFKHLNPIRRTLNEALSPNKLDHVLTMGPKWTLAGIIAAFDLVRYGHSTTVSWGTGISAFELGADLNY